jgi:hypothetical protein
MKASASFKVENGRLCPNMASRILRTTGNSRVIRIKAEIDGMALSMLIQREQNAI